MRKCDKLAGMAYKFPTAADYISYGNALPFQTDQDCSITFWCNILGVSGASIGQRVAQVANAIPMFTATMAPAFLGHTGNGIQFGHVLGGAGFAGFVCAPGDVNPAYTWNSGWLFFACTRQFTGSLYRSYFGSKHALIDGPTYNYGSNIPVPIQPGQNAGPFLIQGFNSMMGPLSYWNRVLSKAECLQLANCQEPVNTAGLLLWVKMFPGAGDSGPYVWAPTFNGAPIYQADDGCSSFTAGGHYSILAT